MSTWQGFNSVSTGASYYPDYQEDFLSAERPVALDISVRDPISEISESHVQSKIRADLDRMVQLGMNVVRMGEFSWSHVEPIENHYFPDRFLFTLDQCLQRGIQVIFCTPTATPPAWLLQKHPEILPRDFQGRTVGSGSRRQYSFVSEVYRRHSARITRYFAEEFGRHSAVAGFQIDNEFGCHGSVFQFGSETRRAFQGWLRRRYDSIDSVNRLWFLSFWSRRYNSFEQIGLPDYTYADNNPHLELEFRRFSNAMVQEFQRAQVSIIREVTGKWVTHNFMSLFKDLDSWQLAGDLDFAGFDHYQMKAKPDCYDSHFQFSLMSSLRPGQPFLLLEQQPLQVNWQPLNRRLSYDLLFQWSCMAAMQGASQILYFSWQRFAGGAERFHDAIVSHDGLQKETWQMRFLESWNDFLSHASAHFDDQGQSSNPDEERQLTSKKNAPTDTNRSRAVFVFDYSSMWAHEICAQSDRYDLFEILRRMTILCQAMGLQFQFSPNLEEAERHYSDAALWILPGGGFAWNESDTTSARSFMHDGGQILSLPTNGLMDGLGRMMPDSLGFIGKGVILEDFGAMAVDEKDSISISVDGELMVLGADLWIERIGLGNAGQNQGVDGNRQYASDGSVESLGRYESGLYAGSPGFISRKWAKGSHLHVTTVPHWHTEEELMHWTRTLKSLLRLDAMAPAWTPPLDVIVLWPDSNRPGAILNYSDQSVALPREEFDNRSEVWKYRLDSRQSMEILDMRDRNITLEAGAVLLFSPREEGSI